MGYKYKVSVIIPYYNAERTIKRAILSVINQTINEYEIITIDDGSLDSSRTIVESIAKDNSNILVLETNRLGAGGARNKGLEFAGGEYICFLDADDFLDSKYFEKMITAIEQNHAQISFCRYQNVDINGNKLITPYEINLSKLIDDLRDIQYFFIPNLIRKTEKRESIIWSIFRCLFKQDIIVDNNIYFNEINFGEDFLFLLEYISFCKKASLVDESLYNYTLVDKSATAHSVGYKECYCKTACLFIDVANDYVGNKFFYEPSKIDEILKIFNLSLAYNMILNFLLGVKEGKHNENELDIIKSIILKNDILSYSKKIGYVRYFLLKYILDNEYTTIVSNAEFLLENNFVLKNSTKLN